MKSKIMTWAFVSLLAFLTACGGSDTTVTEAEEAAAEEELADDLNVEEIQEDTASDVVTTLADVNGFEITTTVRNPRAYDYSNTEVEIVANVKGHNNTNVADGTVVTFVTDDNGRIEEQCATINGSCSVKWWSQRGRNQPVSPDPNSPDAGYVNDFEITIMARTIGEDTFYGKTDSSAPLFEVGDTIMNQSEAFLDANDNYAYDGAVGDFDKYFDFNGDGKFNLAADFTKFRGVSCSATARAQGHCAEKAEIWDSITLINSADGYADIELTDGAGTIIAKTLYGDEVTVSTISLTTATTLFLEVTDRNGNIPPVDTKIEVTTDNGTIDVSPDKVANQGAPVGTGFKGSIRIKPDDESSGGTLTIKTENVDGSLLYVYIPINDTAAPVVP